MSERRTDLIEKTSCTHLFDLFWYCPSPHNQLSYYYREGEFQDCSIFMGDWMKCLNSRLRSKPEDKMRILSTLSTNSRKKVNEVWEIKEVPGWND
mmetsp:Transcript_5543/g.5724  ORF Transcript_5543/g.5724 Transcript_5543/m.5724 type:complete len:95 (+) Transcript_5543:101-385(+)